MPIVATPARRRLAMTVMLGLAVAGGIIRHYADNPSILRDVGSLLLVMWLPAVGNFVGWLVRKIPRAAPPPTDFPAGSAFTPQVRVRLERVPLPEGFMQALDPATRMATALVGRHGFTVRGGTAVVDWLRMDDGEPIAFEFLRPEPALRALAPGTRFHLLVGRTAVAKGQVAALC